MEIKILQFIIFLGVISIFFQSCATIPQSSSSEMSYIKGPLPPDVDLNDVKKNLTRSQLIQNLGTVEVTLMTSPLVYLLNHTKFEERYERKVSNIYENKVIQEKINSEINQLIRYETCFTMKLNTTVARAVGIEYWQGKVIQPGVHKGEVPVRIKNTTENIIGRNINSTPSASYYVSFGTVCTLDRIDILKKFTLVLTPKFQSHVPSFKLVWDKPRDIAGSLDHRLPQPQKPLEDNPSSDPQNQLR